MITAAGRDYLEVVVDALDRIAAGTDRLLQRRSAREDIDIAVRHGDGTDPGLHVTRLYAEEPLARTPAEAARFRSGTIRTPHR